MIRGIAIFSFFALATIAVIVLQPGPRPSYGIEQSSSALGEATRNEVNVLPDTQVQPMLQAPDDVIAKLKAAAKPARAAVQDPSNETSSRSLERLQVALDASLTPVQPIRTDVSTAPKSFQNAAPSQAMAPELRDMSWQTLNALNRIGHVSKAPGQEGSLLNSIVRRSMGQVGSAAPQRPIAVQPRAPVATTPAVKPALATQSARREPFQSAAKQNYIVSSGDTLALIAIKLYGSALATDKLLEENPALRQNPNALRIGQVLNYSIR